MSDVVNLNQFRKKRARDGKERRAEENRKKFGRTKPEKARDKAASEHLQRHLDSHKTDITDK